MSRARRLEQCLLVAACAAIAWFYAWTVRASNESWDFGAEQDDYYNFLIDGWLDGQLHMKVNVPPALLALDDPYDPQKRPPDLGLHDASFYRGKYYVYFGVAPVVALMLPFRLITGLDLPLGAAVLAFAYGGFLAMAALWLDVRRRYFPETGMIVAVLIVLTLGLANLVPVLLRRPHMWELPIGAGFCFAMLTLLAVWRSLHAADAAGRATWFGAAGLCLGLAIASRPTYLLASPLLAVPLLFWWRESRVLPWRPLVSAVVPLAVIGAAMAWHNYARFGNPLQFGQAYQFSLDYESKMQHFSPGYVGFNGWRYFFSVAEWSRYFPFIGPAELPTKPRGFGGHDDVYGVLANLPFAWLALAAPLALWRRDATERRRLGAWLLAATVLFAVMAGVLLCFFGSLARYQVDFTPTLMLLAGVGLLAIERWRQAVGARALRTGVRAGWGVAAVASAIFGVLFSLQSNGRLRDIDADAFRATARLFNRLPALVERLGGVRHGPIELTFQLPPAAAGSRRLIVSAGNAPAVDKVFMRQLEGNRVHFEIQTANDVTRLTRPVVFDFSQPHTLRLAMGSLLPPETHPAADALSKVQFDALARRLRVELDGEVLIDLAPWFPTAPGRVALPEEPWSRAATTRRDETQWAALAAKPAARPLDTPVGTGVVRLRVMLPRDRSGLREPLIVAGRPGRGDFVYIEYLDAGTVRFGFDHWGGMGATSPPASVDYGRPIAIRIAMDSLRAPSKLTAGRSTLPGELEVAVDGRSVWRMPVEVFNVPPEEVVVADNLIGGTSCRPVFTGEVLAVERVPRN
jgi:hypothetical protein